MCPAGSRSGSGSAAGGDGAPRDWTAWLSQARAILSAFHGPQAGPVSVTIRNTEGQEIVLTAPADGAPTAPLPSLSPMEADIVRVVGRGCLAAKQIARRLGIPCNSTLRVLLSNLCERGVLEPTRQGYRCVSDMSDISG